MTKFNIADLRPGTAAYDMANESVRYLSDWLENEGRSDFLGKAYGYEIILEMVKQYSPGKFDEMLGYSDELGVWNGSDAQENPRLARYASNLRNKAVFHEAVLLDDPESKAAVEQVVELYKQRVADLANK
jgi:hypothetical protein